MKVTRYEIRDSKGAVLAVSADEVDAVALLRAFAWTADDSEDAVMLVPVDTAGVPVGRTRRLCDL